MGSPTMGAFCWGTRPVRSQRPGLSPRPPSVASRRRLGRTCDDGLCCSSTPLRYLRSSYMLPPTEAANRVASLWRRGASHATTPPSRSWRKTLRPSPPPLPGSPPRPGVLPSPGCRGSCTPDGRLCQPSSPVGGATGAAGVLRRASVPYLKRPLGHPGPSPPLGRWRLGCPRWIGMAPHSDAMLYSAGSPPGMGNNAKRALPPCGLGSSGKTGSPAGPARPGVGKTCGGGAGSRGQCAKSRRRAL